MNDLSRQKEEIILYILKEKSRPSRLVNQLLKKPYARRHTAAVFYHGGAGFEDHTRNGGACVDRDGCADLEELAGRVAELFGDGLCKLVPCLDVAVENNAVGRFGDYLVSRQLDYLRDNRLVAAYLCVGLDLVVVDAHDRPEPHRHSDKGGRCCRSRCPYC